MIKTRIILFFIFIPKLHRWYKKFHSASRILGTPINEEKLWNLFKKYIRNYLQSKTLDKILHLYHGKSWVEARTIGVRIQLHNVKPVTPSKKFIITLTDLPQSMNVAKRCLESAKRYNEHHGMELWPAVSKFEALDFFKSHQLTWFHTDYNLERKKDPLPEMGCFASHYMLWKHCIELNQAIIILEHDAIIRSPIPPLKFKHIIMLSRFAFGQKKYRIGKITMPSPREIFYPLDRLAAAHCYAITPKGAQILTKVAQHNIIVPADAFINKDKVNILYYHPYLVDFDYKFSTIDSRQKNSPTPQEVWDGYKKTSSS